MKLKRAICRIFDHQRRPIVRLVHADGTVTYHGHPDGKHVGCHRCRRVLKEN